MRKSHEVKGKAVSRSIVYGSKEETKKPKVTYALNIITNMGKLTVFEHARDSYLFVCSDFC